MTLIDTSPLQLQIPPPNPNPLKSSSSLELGYDIPIVGLRTSVPRLSAKEKNTITIAEAPCEVNYSSESAGEEKPLSSTEAVVEVGGYKPQQRIESQPSKINLLDIPDEVQQHVLSYLVGNLTTLLPKASDNGNRNWHYALRHSRAKEHTNLALVTRKWTTFIQQRLYRHIRIQGTRQSLHECYVWFVTRPHLQSHVRHIELWIPLWEKRPLVSIPIPTRLEDLHLADSVPVSNNYQLSSDRVTIEEIFKLAKSIFDKACILTLQGGTCKKPPKVSFTRRDSHRLPELPNIRTLVLKGAWTLVRDTSDFHYFSEALPNLKDWQCMFAIPKHKAYVAMNAIVPKIPSRLTHLQLCMDGLYSKKWLSIMKVEDLRRNHHLCLVLGKLMLQLEALTFSGRACYSLFSAAVEACARNGITKPRLQSLDLTLRSCCRDRLGQIGESPGLYCSSFIEAFEKLVVAATSSLKTFTNLTSIRIRFVDLDSPLMYLNPYFRLKDSVAYGLASETIDNNLLSLARPITLATDREVAECSFHSFAHGRRPIGRRPNRISITEYADTRIGHW